jgi:2'-5' RNA ligase
MDKATKRVFFALWPEDSTRTELTAAMSRLKTKVTARWIRPENLHMTLAFLGEVETKRLEGLTNVADAVHSHSFELQLDRIEHWRKPQVICLTPTATSPIPGQLAADLTARLRDAGFVLEKRTYRAHLSLARNADYLPEDVRLEQPILWQSTAFVLVESTREPQGSQYAIVESWPLSVPPCIDH